MAIIYSKRAFLLILTFFSTLFFIGCATSKEENKAVVKSHDLEKVLWSEVRKDSLVILQSCRKLLQEFPESPYAKITAYLGYANYFEKQNDDKSAKTMAQRALIIAQKSSFSREIAYCHIQLSEISNNLNNLNEVSLQLQKVEEILNKNAIKEEFLWSKYHEEKGLYFRKIEQYENAIIEFQKMLVFANKKRLFFQEAQANFYISWMYSETSKYEECWVQLNI